MIYIYIYTSTTTIDPIWWMVESKAIVFDKTTYEYHHLSTPIVYLPSVLIGKTFVQGFADEFDGVMERKWDMERVVCYISRILQTSSNIKVAANVIWIIK